MNFRRKILATFWESLGPYRMRESKTSDTRFGLLSMTSWAPLFVVSINDATRRTHFIAGKIVYFTERYDMIFWKHIFCEKSTFGGVYKTLSESCTTFD